MERRINRVTAAVWQFSSGAVGSLTHSLVLHTSHYQTGQPPLTPHLMPPRQLNALNSARAYWAAQCLALELPAHASCQLSSHTSCLVAAQCSEVSCLSAAHCSELGSCLLGSSVTIRSEPCSFYQFRLSIPSTVLKVQRHDLFSIFRPC